MGDELIAAVLSFCIPGLGQYYIKSKYAMHYFVGAVAVWIVTSIALLMTLFLCLPLYLVPPAFHLVAAVDAYNEALKKPRVLMEFIK